MKFIANVANNVHFQWILDNCPRSTRSKYLPTEIKAAVAYATHKDILDFANQMEIKLTFYGRYDYTVPVKPWVLKPFLDADQNNATCKLIKKLHAKVVWFVGYGVYIGSANFTRTAWENGLEVGCWFPEDALSNYDKGELNKFFSFCEQQCFELNDDLYSRLCDWYEKRQKKEQEQEEDFEQNVDLTQGNGKKQNKLRKGLSKYERFFQEWTQVFGEVQKLVPVAKAAMAGTTGAGQAPNLIQVDQFLHAYYQNNVEHLKGGVEANSWRLHRKNRSNPQGAIELWSQECPELVKSDIYIEKAFSRAKRMQDLLSEKRIADLSEKDFGDLLLGTNAYWSARRFILKKNERLAFQKRERVNEKLLEAIWLYRCCDDETLSTTKRIFNFLYGGPPEEVVKRLYQALKEKNPEYKIPHFGPAMYGELLGWAMPEKYPIRNNRTNRALYAMGKDVKIF